MCSMIYENQETSQQKPEKLLMCHVKIKKLNKFYLSQPEIYYN